jgi:hypothetical protein
MELGKRGRAIWWALLMLLGIGYLVGRGSAMFLLPPAPIDIIVLLVLIALLLSPLFSELDILGLKLRKELDDLKHDVRSQILTLRNEMLTAVNLRAEISPTFHITSVPSPAPDAELARIEEPLRRMLQDILRSYGVADRGGGGDAFATPEATAFLFGARYHLETRLRSIWEAREGEQALVRSAPLHRLVEVLVTSGVLNPDIAYMIREIYSICSVAIHGQTVTDEQTRFVQANIFSLLAYLDAVLSGR